MKYVLYAFSLSLAFVVGGAHGARADRGGAGAQEEGSPTAPDQTAAGHEEEGARLYQAREYVAAIRQFTAAYKLDPQLRYMLYVAQVYRKLGLATEALEYYQRYLRDEPRPDPLLRADILSYIEQVQASLNPAAPVQKPAREPAPFLTEDETLDAEEHFAQFVRDYKEGRNAAAVDRMNQLKEVYRTRRDPSLLYYIASAFDQVKKSADALEYYRRYLGTEPPDNPLRTRAAARVRALRPPPPGQKYLWPSLALGAVGLAGVLTGVGLYVQSKDTFDQFERAVTEAEKRSLRDRGQPLITGSAIAYGVGGGVLAMALGFTVAAIKKGVRQKPEVYPREAPEEAPLAPSVSVLLHPGGGSLALGGTF
jgi:tetratricopeptide (TPR) repeat protein